MAVLKEGSKAPAIKALDQNGKAISLADYKGKKVILYFYPKDDTPGCTAQACNLKDNHSALIKKGFQVLGVSVDSVKSHKKFEEKYELPFPLISDEDKKIVDKYNLWGEKKIYGKNLYGHYPYYFFNRRSGDYSQNHRQTRYQEPYRRNFSCLGYYLNCMANPRSQMHIGDCACY